MKIIAIKVEQPLSEFFVSKLKAKDLLKLCFSEQLQYIDENGTLKGSQRQVNKQRLIEIGKYIDSVEMSFPNSIILAANYSPEGKIEQNEEIRWTINKLNNDLFEINIPTMEKLAVIVDGQHRLFAFENILNKERLEVEIPCSIFFDLPNPFQAYLFATINGNQKNVDKSLALEQFGFNVEDEDPKSWTPEKFAVYFARRLNFHKRDKSVFFGKIKLAPLYNENIININKDETIISTAAIVEGILRLISSNPKRDRVEMGQIHIFKGRHRSMLKEFKDNSPLRKEFIELNDDVILFIIKIFFKQVSDILWAGRNESNYLKKTVGIQALFNLLREILLKNNDKIYFINEEFFRSILLKFTDIDFSDNFFTASGIGKSRIQNTLFIRLGIKNIDSIQSENEQKNYRRILAL